MTRRRYFWIPAISPAEAGEELNRFLRAHRIVSVEQHFVAGRLQSAWAVCGRSSGTRDSTLSQLICARRQGGKS